MKKIQGKIAKAGAYPLRAPKTVKFGDENKTFTHRHTVQMETGEWIGFGESDMDAFKVKDDDGKWTILGAGSEVLIKYTESPCGSFKNAKKTNLTLLDLVAGEAYNAPAKAQQAPQTHNAGQPASKGSFVNPAARGQAMNLAAEVLGYKEADFSDAKKIVYAIKWYLTSAKDFESLWDTAEKAIIAGNTVIPPSKPKPKKAAVVEDNYDDDEV